MVIWVQSCKFKYKNNPVSLAYFKLKQSLLFFAVDIIGQDAPEYAAPDMSVYGGVQMGSGGGGAQSEANYSTLTTISRADPEMDSKRKAHVSTILLVICVLHYLKL